jgi:hypothetical protein
MIGGMTRESQGTHKVLADITIHLDMQPEEHLDFQNQRAAQVGLLSNIKGEGPSQTIFKESSGGSSHQQLMENIGREKKLNPGCWA